MQRGGRLPGDSGRQWRYTDWSKMKVDMANERAMLAFAQEV